MISLVEQKVDWVYKPREEFKEALLCRELGISSLLAATLVSRGLAEPAAAERYLNPSLDQLHDPRLLPDYEPAVKEILAAKERGDKIFVHGDYDVDGVTSAAIFGRFLRKVGCDVVVHVPHRMREGYGIHLDAVHAAHEAGAKLFLTCDCGVAAHAQVEKAKAFGMRVVVTDHHEIAGELPAAHAVINPHRSDSRYPYDKLAGAGVVFKLCEGLTEELGHERRTFQRAYLDLAALGTIADVMDLDGENRVIAKLGLEQLTLTKKEGLVALKMVSDVKGPVDARTVGFVLAPRLNASGRIDDAALSLQLLLETDKARAFEIAGKVDAINTERKAEQERILQEACEAVQANEEHLKPMIVVEGENWHKGVVGIVAGRIAEQFWRPTFVLNKDVESGTHSGSARSIPGFNLVGAIHSNIELFISGGGHAEAAGCKFESARYEEVKAALLSFAEQHMTEEMLTRRLRADAELSMDEITRESAEELSRMKPFGKANPEPVFVARGVNLKEATPTKNPKVKLLRFSDGNKVWKGVAFQGTELEGAKDLKLDIAFKLKMEEFRGYTELKLSLEDFAQS